MEGMDRLIEIMAEMLDEQRGMRKEQALTNQRLGSLEKQMVKNNLGVGQLRVSVMRLADESDKILLLDKHVTKSEDVVFRKSA